MIQIMDVKKSFGAEEVLHGITREFEPGKIHGIVEKELCTYCSQRYGFDYEITKKNGR